MREHFVALLYAVRLQELGQPTTPEQFLDCNKAALVSGGTQERRF